MTMHEPGSRRLTLVETVAADVRARVDDGRWPIGSRIPVESELVELLGVGRNTVREAVASLVHSGVLSRQQGRGTFVIGSGEAQTPTARSLVSRATRRDALQLRSALDTEAVRIAARRANVDDVTELRRLLDARSAAWREGGTGERIAADTAVHRAVIALSGNALFIQLYDGLLGLFEAVLVEDVQGDADPHEKQHRAMVDAIARRDPDAAAAQLDELLLPLRRDVGE